jgi:predicted enzyme related to lactoylglutathione lyase
MNSSRRKSRATAAVLALASLGVAVAQPVLAASPVLPAIADPATHAAIPGKFVWFDLATSDGAASKRFYGKVFGWEFQQLGGTLERYAVIRNEGRPIGGMFRPKAPPGDAVAASQVGARWLSIASVANMDRTMAAMTAGGAQVLMPATVVEGFGTRALMRDSQGAVVGLVQSSSGDRKDAPVEAGEFFWVDLYTRDPAAAARAYQQLGFEVSSDEVSGDDRLVLSTQGYARAGILRLPPDGREPGWLPYVQVGDVPATLARVRAAGGKVLREPDPAILGGRLAVFADPQGGVLGILNWTAADSKGAQP